MQTSQFLEKMALALGKLGIWVLVAFALYALAAAVFSYWVYDSTYTFVVANLGWDTRTAKLLASVATLVFTCANLWTMVKVILLGSRKPEHFLSAILPGLILFILDFLFRAPVNQLDGTVSLCCARRERGQLHCQVIDTNKNAKCGIDSVTGKLMHRATRRERVLWNENRLAASLGTIPIPPPTPVENQCTITEYFDGTKEPLYWYFEHGGKYDLFDDMMDVRAEYDAPLHPKYGEPLKPITQDVVFAIERACETAKAAKAAKPDKPYTPSTSPQPLVMPWSKYIDIGRIHDSKNSRINAIVIRGNNELRSTILESLGNAFRANVFTAQFIRDGLFERAISGDASAISDLQLPASFRRILLIHIDNPTRSSLNRATKVSYRIKAFVLDAKTGALTKGTSIYVEGAGYAEQYVDQAVREDASRKFASLKSGM
jgi:hypothetical protein